MTAFSPKQRTVLTWWMPGNPNRGKEAIVCDGSVRSGKTLAMGLSFFLWAMSCFNRKKFGICGKTIASLRRNVLPEILPKLVAESGAHSTDLEAPESAEHLCEKCRAYAAAWKPRAEQLWDEEHPKEA